MDMKLDSDFDISLYCFVLMRDFHLLESMAKL